MTTQPIIGSSPVLIQECGFGTQGNFGAACYVSPFRSAGQRVRALLAQQRRSTHLPLEPPDRVRRRRRATVFPCPDDDREQFRLPGRPGGDLRARVR